MIKAVLLSPLAAPLTYFLGALLFGGGADWEVKDYLSLLMVVSFIATPVSYLATVVFGFPYFWLLKRFDLLSGPALVAGGIIFGVLSFLLFWGGIWSLKFVFSLSGSELMRLIGIGAVLGGGVSLCFAYTSGITSRSTRTRAKNARAS